VTDVRLKYLHCFRDRHGKARYYFRYRDQRWPVPAPGTLGFATAYDALLAQIRANPVGRGQGIIEFMPGSLGWAIERFLASPFYSERAETTRRNYRRVLDRLREKYGAGLLRDLKPRHVRTMRNEIAATSTTAADIAMGLISGLWDFAVERLGLELDADPTHGIKRIHRVKHEHEPWPAELIERFLREARPSLRWAVRLALYTGQRRSDLVKMRWSQFDGEWIEVRQQKTGALLSIPCHAELRVELQSMSRVADTILVGERSAPLTGSSLSVMVRRALREMGINGYSIHGLRKNAGASLADAGCTPHEIAAITGHKTLGMVQHYTKKRDQRVAARSAMDKWEQSGKPKNAMG